VASEKKDPQPGWKEGLVFFALRICDAGYTGWILIAAFFLGVLFIFTRNLSSSDTLALLRGIGTLNGFAWIGWIFAIAEIPIMRWLLDKARRDNTSHLQHLEAENEKARKILKKHKQTELNLEEEQK